MTLQTADYVFVAFATAMALTGLLRGFSGTVAFVAASAAGSAAGSVAWALSARCLDPLWHRVVATCAAAVLAFGIVRFAVKKLVNGLLAQPSDALFGLLCGVAGAALVLAAWVCSGAFVEYSAIATAAAERLREWGMLGPAAPVPPPPAT